MRGVDRLRWEMFPAASSEISTPMIPAERRMITASSSGE